MIGIPWSHLKTTLALQGHLPLLGWPSDIDPMDCMFTFDGKRALAIKSEVLVAEWSSKDPEWMDLR